MREPHRSPQTRGQETWPPLVPCQAQACADCAQTSARAITEMLLVSKASDAPGLAHLQEAHLCLQEVLALSLPTWLWGQWAEGHGGGMGESCSQEFQDQHL